MTEPVLAVEGATKSFPGVKALDDVSFAINKGEVVGLIGENGAGKSTLLKVLNGIYRPDEGGIFVDGQPITITSPRQAFDSGIAMVFQEQSVLPTLTVAENIFLGRETEFIRFGLISKRRMNAAAAKELALQPDQPRWKVGKPSGTQRRQDSLPVWPVRRSQRFAHPGSMKSAD